MFDFFRSQSKVGKRFLEVKDLKKNLGKEFYLNRRISPSTWGESSAYWSEMVSGKTTFLNIIMGKEQVCGDIWVSPFANVGYLTQEVFDLPLEQTPEQFFHHEPPF